ncbi:SDR family oxidoreductase [Streptomyces sp. A10(2020)]|uniref:SDR family oxidoreductase n=1 Tax=Streptomyces sp. A10(2020) TaxID=2782013 RepID=UPI001F5DE5FD|nr:SDR family oxidoreductase [Streptomyces sp. A10(2020)]UNR58462.1 SDR family oxidoreductase [Streptomyces sp. A10(2020)]
MSIVVTGATGSLGRLVVDELLRGGVPAGRIVALARDERKAAPLAALGVEVRLADYDRPETLEAAFGAGDRVLLVSGSEIGRRVPQHTAVVEAAARAGVAQFAYTSVLGGPEADFELAREHQVTEKLILESGLPYTLLRNGWYSEVYTEQLATPLEHGAVTGSAPREGRIASAPRADYAAAAAAVLTGEGHLNTAYELSGDTAWSLPEYAALVSEATGREIAYREIPAEAHLAIFTGAGLPEELAAILVDVDRAIGRGLLAATPGDLARLIGRPTTPVAATVADAVAALKG